MYKRSHEYILLYTVVVLIYLGRIYQEHMAMSFFIMCSYNFVWFILLYTGGDTVGGDRCEAKNSWLGMTLALVTG